MISKALVIGAYHTKLEEMVRLGVTLDVVIPQDWGDQKAERIQGDGYTLSALPVVFSGHNHFHFYPTLSTIIKKIKPDIIHVDEESFSLVTYLVMRQARTLEIPTIFFNWQNIFKVFPWPFSAMERYTLKYAAAGIAGSAEAKEVLMRKGCQIPISIIPQFGVDTQVFFNKHQTELRNEIINNPDSFVVGYVGRLVKEKGIDDLLQACKLLQREIHIVLIGTGNQRAELERNAQLYGISGRVHFVDHVKSTDMPQYLNILDCLVLPSHTHQNWKEQFGRVLIEAMACEVPVVGSNSGEIPLVIGQAGLVYPEGNIQALRNAIERLFVDKVFRMKMSREGRLRIEKCFLQRQIAESTVEVYRRVLTK
jgi:glycosyltransferase involved in cell wall biosynthesis